MCALYTAWDPSEGAQGYCIVHLTIEPGYLESGDVAQYVECLLSVLGDRWCDLKVWGSNPTHINSLSKIQTWIKHKPLSQYSVFKNKIPKENRYMESK